MRSWIRSSLLLSAMVVCDAGVLQIAMMTDLSAPAARLLSLSIALLMSSLLAQVLPARPKPRRPGRIPLLIVALLLNFALFVTLSLRTPEIRPLAHLAAAWVATLLFATFGLLRIGRWRAEADGD